MKKIFICNWFLFSVVFLSAQENYEIQVYGSETTPKNETVFELHSNFTGKGSLISENGVYFSNKIEHETIEITHGFGQNFEIGFYLFNAIGSQSRTGFVGTHIRPRVRVPENWHWPIGASLSAEIGVQNKLFSEDDFTLELRPIFDKSIHKIYFSFNPVLGKAFHGLNSKESFDFSPNLKASYELSKKVIGGLEYYGSLGTLNKFAPRALQDHCLFFAFDLDVHPKWELNFGYGVALNEKTDGNIIKMILGYRLFKGK
jgi:hypothetical protein